MTQPVVVKFSTLLLQVCVPDNYTDEQIVEYAEQTLPRDTAKRWKIVREGDSKLGKCNACDRGYAEREPCEERPDCVHVLLEI